IPRTSPSDETISVTTRPQPPCRFTRRRKAVSVMPAIGATTNGDGSSIDPIFMAGSVGPDVGGIDFNADGLSDEIHRQHQTSLVVLAHQASNDSGQRTVYDLDHHAFPNHRTRIVCEVALHQTTNSVYLLLGYGRRLTFERDDADDAGAFQDGQT